MNNKQYTKLFFIKELNSDSKFTDRHRYIFHTLYVKVKTHHEYDDAYTLAELKELVNFDEVEVTVKELKMLHYELGFIELSKILGKDNVRQILEDLINWEVIQCDDKYISAKYANELAKDNPKYIGLEAKCYGYRIHPQYSNVEVTKYPIADKKFRRKHMFYRVAQFEHLSKTHQAMSDMIQNNFHFDITASTLLLEEFKNVDDFKWNATYKKYNTDKKKITHRRMTEEYKLNHLQHRIDNIQFAIDMLEDQDYYFTTDKKTGRVFHNYSNLKSEFRSCIRDENGKPLIEWDIANSQPFFFSTTLSSRMPDVLLYKELCKTGQLYEYLCMKFGYERSVVKQNILTMFFGKTNWNYALKEQFISEFPNVWNVIQLNKDKDYKLLSKKLQKIEADIMISGVGKKLVFMGIPFITVHDSVMCSSEFELDVLQVLQECFYSKYGILPHFKNK